MSARLAENKALNQRASLQEDNGTSEGRKEIHFGETEQVQSWVE
jgi:hypothetical protein